jgi:tetratricopeptide (TPR) repeat protein
MSATRRTSRAHRLAVAFAWALGLTMAASPAHAHQPAFLTPEEHQKAEDLMAQGKALSRAGKLEEACAAYRAAWAIDPSFRLAANLGDLELKLSHFRDAAEHLAYALRMFPADGKPDLRTSLSHDLGEAKKHVAALMLLPSPDNADVAVDGRGIDWDDAVHEVYVEPGPHDIGATLNGYAPAHQRVDAKAGETLNVTIALAPLPSEPAPLPPRMPESPAEPAPRRALDAPTGPNIVLLSAGAATTALGVTIGIAYAMRAGESSGYAASIDNVLRASGGSGACNLPANANACATLDTVLRDQSTSSNVAVWSFVGAGAVALGTAAYGVWPRARGTSRGAVRLLPEPIVTTTARGIVVRGEW